MAISRWLFSLLLFCALGAFAEDEEAEAPAEPGEENAVYIELKPPLVVNFGGPGKLRYIKAEMSVRVISAEVARSVRHHMPFIRNNLLMLFSAQTEEQIDSVAGREALRSAAYEEICSIVRREDGGELADGVRALYFNNFIVQK